MDINDAIRSRRTIKDFALTPVTRETLLQLVEAARFSPSGGNKNTWHFVITTQRRTLDTLAETHPHCRWFLSSQAGIAFVVDPTSTRYWLEDCCVAATCMWLAATGMGLGVAWAAMYQADDREENNRRQRFVRRLLGIPPDLNVPIVLGLGFPKGTPPAKKRPSADELVFWDTYPPKD